MAPGPRRILTIEATDLDTGERSEALAREVMMPAAESAQRSELAEAVAPLFPQARLRSFGGEAASFLESGRLVVAHYRAVAGGEDHDPGPPSTEAEQPSQAEPPAVQSQLFAA